MDNVTCSNYYQPSVPIQGFSTNPIHFCEFDNNFSLIGCKLNTLVNCSAPTHLWVVSDKCLENPLQFLSVSAALVTVEVKVPVSPPAVLLWRGT